MKPSKRSKRFVVWTHSTDEGWTPNAGEPMSESEASKQVRFWKEAGCPACYLAEGVTAESAGLQSK